MPRSSRFAPWIGWRVVLRAETKRRARALQLLYAWELTSRPPMAQVMERCIREEPRLRAALEDAEPVAAAVAASVSELDHQAALAVEHWRPERVGVIEQNILRLAIRELQAGTVPPKVAISEAVRLAHWFAGPGAPGFVNGVLDAIARRAGRL